MTLNDELTVGSPDPLKILPDKLAVGSPDPLQILPDELTVGSTDPLQILPNELSVGSPDPFQILPDELTVGSPDPRPDNALLRPADLEDPDTRRGEGPDKLREDGITPLRGEVVGRGEVRTGEGEPRNNLTHQN